MKLSAFIRGFQNEPQRVLYHDTVHILSPYKVLQQTTKVGLPCGGTSSQESALMEVLKTTSHLYLRDCLFSILSVVQIKKTLNRMCFLVTELSQRLGKISIQEPLEALKITRVSGQCFTRHISSKAVLCGFCYDCP